MVELKPVQTISSNVFNFKMSLPRPEKMIRHPNTGGTFGKFKLKPKQNCKIAPKPKAIMSPLTTVPKTQFNSPMKVSQNFLQNGMIPQAMRMPEMIVRPPPPPQTINSFNASGTKIIINAAEQPNKIVAKETVKIAVEPPKENTAEIPRSNGETNNDNNNNKNTEKHVEIKDNKENVELTVATSNQTIKNENNSSDEVVAVSAGKPEEQDSSKENASSTNNNNNNDNNTSNDNKENILATCKPKRVLMDDVNPYISCNLCKGYLIDATTIVECLHTFCHSCLMQHLLKEKFCPQCQMEINKSKTNIKYDATLQSIVYKLVPGLYEKELLRKRAFYRSRPVEAKLATPEQRGDDTEHLIFGPSDNISLSLDYLEKESLEEMEEDENVKELKQTKYLQCPAIFRIEHLKKFVVNKYKINTKAFSVEICYKVKNVVLPDHYTLMDVAYIYIWKREAPMAFYFRVTFNDNASSTNEPITKLPTLPSIPEEETTTSSSEKKPEISESDKKLEVTNVTSQNDVKSEGIKIKIKNIDMVPDVKKEKYSKSKEREKEKEKEKDKDKVKQKQKSVENVPIIKLKVDKSNQSVSIVTNTAISSPSPSKSELKVKKKKDKKRKLENDEESYRKIKDKSENSSDKSYSDDKLSRESEYDFKDTENIDQDGFFNVLQLIRKPNSPKDNNKEVSPSKAPTTTTTISTQTPKPASSSNRTFKSPPPTHTPTLSGSVTKRKVKDPVKLVPKKFKSNEMKTVTQGEKFLTKKVREGKEITFDLSPQPLGSKPAPQKITMEMIQAEKAERAAAEKAEKERIAAAERAEKERIVAEKLAAVKAKEAAEKLAAEQAAAKEKIEKMAAEKRAMMQKALAEKQSQMPPPPPSMPSLQPIMNYPVFAAPTQSPSNPQPKPLPPKFDPELVKSVNLKVKKDEVMKPPQKPKKLPVLLPKPIESLMGPPPMLPLSSKSNSSGSEISVMKINDMNGERKVFGPPSLTEKKTDNFLFPTPPKQSTTTQAKSSQNMPAAYGMNIKTPKNIPANMVTPYGMRTPFYAPSSPSYSPDSPAYTGNYSAKPQHKYTNPTAYASFLQGMYKTNMNVTFNKPTQSTSNGNRSVSPPPLQPVSSSSISNDRKRSINSPDNTNGLPAKRKTPSPTQKPDGSKLMLNNISFPSSLSVTLTNEQEENKKEQLRNMQQNAVNNNIEIIKLPDVQNNEEKRNGNNNKSPSPPLQKQEQQKIKDEKEENKEKELDLSGQAGFAGMKPPIANILSETKESFQRKFLESIYKPKKVFEGLCPKAIKEKMKKMEMKNDCDSSKQGKDATTSSTSQPKSGKVTPPPKKTSALAELLTQKPNDTKDSTNKPKRLLPSPTQIKPPNYIDLSGSPEKKSLSITAPTMNPPIIKKPPKIEPRMPPNPLANIPTTHDLATNQQIANVFRNAALLNIALGNVNMEPNIANLQQQFMLNQLRQNIQRSQAALAMAVHQSQNGKNPKSPSNN